MNELKRLKTAVVALVLLVSSPSIAQVDTIYLDSKFQPTEKGKHEYYRLLDQMPSGNYKIRDYYKSGAIQMAGYTDQPDDKHLTGTVVRYKPDGKISSVCEHKTYQDGWITFYDENFIKASSLWCVQGIKNGVAYFYDNYGKQIAKGWYKDDRPYKGNMPEVLALSKHNPFTFKEYTRGKKTGLTKFYAPGRKAMVAKLDSTGYALASAKYFAQNGKLLGVCTYENKLPVQGTHVEYYDKTFYSFRPATIKYTETYKDGELTGRKSYTPHGVYVGNCTFTYGAPLDGKWLRGETMETYVNGLVEGEVIQWSSDLRREVYSYTVMDGMKHGPTSYTNPITDSVYIGSYKNDHPDTGYIYHRSELCYYADAKKKGLCRLFDSKGNLTSYTYYINNKREGESVSYEYPKLGHIKGWNKSGEPFGGDFVTSTGRTISVIHYENGRKIHINDYSRESFVLISNEDLATQTTTYFDTNGVVMYKGIKKNDKPFEGTFKADREISMYQNGKLNGEKRYYDAANQLIKFETYVNDTLDGPYLFNKDKSTVLKGIYYKGSPYSGSFLNEDKSSVLTYEWGMIQGPVQVKDGSFSCHYTYADDVKTGNAVCWRLNYKTGSDTMVFHHLMPDVKDTLFLYGTYEDDKPVNGTFLESNAISQYTNGKKHGYSFFYTSFSHVNILGFEIYQNGVRDGEAVYYIDGRPFHSVYQNGQIVNGIMPEENHFSRRLKNEFAIFENGIRTGDSLISKPELEWLHKKGGLPFEGFKRREPDYSLLDEYQQGRLVKTSFTTFNRDTVWVMMYHGDSSVTYDKAKNIIAKTTYTDTYSDGVARLYNDGILSNTIRFKDGYIDMGCLDYELRPGTLGDDTKNIRICKDSIAVALFLTPAVKRISKELILPADTKVVWPYTFTQGSYYKLIDVKQRTDKYYDKVTGRLLATYITSKQGNFGTKIRQDGNRYFVEHTGESGKESYELSYDEMIEKLIGWDK